MSTTRRQALMAELSVYIARRTPVVLRRISRSTTSSARRVRESCRGAYNLPADTKRNGDVIRMPKDQRMGVLTHPAWLVAHSGNFDNDPIRRGLWIRKHLLGGMVPDVPITVDAKLPDEPT